MRGHSNEIDENCIDLDFREDMSFIDQLGRSSTDVRLLHSETNAIFYNFLLKTALTL